MAENSGQQKAPPALKKYIEVYLGGPDGELWCESFENIAAERTKHFMGRAEVGEGTDQHKRLVDVSNRQEEVEDWARRFTAPEALRNSWYSCIVTVFEADPATVKTGIGAKNDVAKHIRQKHEAEKRRKVKEDAERDNANVQETADA